MLGLSSVAGVVLIVLLLPLRDTPRWYLRAGRRDEVAAELERIHPGDSEARFRELEASMAVFQQITGINAIIYYADEIFAAAGFTSPAKASTAVNAGRVAGDAGIITLVALVVYVASFAFSLGPIVWTMINEIYPRGVRGRAVSVATAANWLSAWVVSQLFLSFVDWVGESATFWLFALMCVICLVWIVKKVAETKGRTLEEIEAMWTHGDGGAPGGNGSEGLTDAWGTAASGSS